MSKINNLFFDFDMTLGYRISMWKETVKELLLEENFVVEKLDFIDFIAGGGYPWARSELSHTDFFKGLTWWEYVGKFIYDNLIKFTDGKTAKKVAEAFPAKYCDIKYWRVFKDTKEVLPELKKNYNLYLLSNHVPEAREIIEKLKLAEYFDKMIFSSEYEYEKPHVKIFNYAIEECDAQPENSVMIGDNLLADIMGAKQIGMNAVLVRKENISKYPYYCKTLYELPACLEKLENTVENK